MFLNLCYCFHMHFHCLGHSTASSYWWSWTNKGRHFNVWSCWCFSSQKPDWCEYTFAFIFNFCNGMNPLVGWDHLNRSVYIIISLLGNEKVPRGQTEASASGDIQTRGSCHRHSRRWCKPNKSYVSDNKLWIKWFNAKCAHLGADALPNGLDVTFEVKEMRRMTGSYNTMVGNNEGSMVSYWWLFIKCILLRWKTKWTVTMRLSGYWNIERLFLRCWVWNCPMFLVGRRRWLFSFLTAPRKHRTVCHSSSHNPDTLNGSMFFAWYWWLFY